MRPHVVLSVPLMTFSLTALIAPLLLMKNPRPIVAIGMVVFWIALTILAYCSRTVRIVIPIAMQSLVLNKLRLMLLVLILKLSVQGSLVNALDNVQEVLRGAGSLSIHLKSQAQDYAKELKGGNLSADAVEKLREAMKPLEELAEMGKKVDNFMSSAINSAKDFYSGVKTVLAECEEETLEPSYACRQLFTNIYDKCMDIISFERACELFNEAAVVCDPLRVLAKTCEVPKTLAAMLTRSVEWAGTEIKESAEKFIEQNYYARLAKQTLQTLEIKLTIEHHSSLKIKGLDELKKTIADFVATLRYWIEVSGKPIDVVIALLAVHPFYMAWSYAKRKLRGHGGGAKPQPWLMVWRHAVQTLKSLLVPMTVVFVDVMLYYILLALYKVMSGVVLPTPPTYELQPAGGMLADIYRSLMDRGGRSIDDVRATSYFCEPNPPVFSITLPTLAGITFLLCLVSRYAPCIREYSWDMCMWMVN